MADIVECEIGVAMNEDGDWIVRPWEENIIEDFNNEVGGATIRVIKVTVKMALPFIQEALITIPDEAGETITATAE